MEMNKTLEKLKMNILNNFINNELFKIAIDYMKLKMNDNNRKENELIIKQLDFLLEMTSKEIDLKIYSNINFNKNNQNELNEKTKEEFNQIQSIFKNNPYYEKIFNRFLFYVHFLFDTELQNKVFYDLYSKIKKAYDDLISEKLSKKINRELIKVSKNQKYNREKKSSLNKKTYLYFNQFSLNQKKYLFLNKNNS